MDLSRPAFLGPYVCNHCGRPTAHEDMHHINKTSPTGHCRDCRRTWQRTRDAARAVGCSFPRCRNKARREGGLCSGHRYQQSKGRTYLALAAS